MTVNDGSENDGQQPDAKPQRPFAMLDLTAKEVSAEDPPATAAPQPDAPRASTGSALPPPAPEASVWTREGNMPAYMSNLVIPLASGALGASLAFLIAYSLIGNGGDSADRSSGEIAALRGEIAQSRKDVAALQTQLRDVTAKSGQLDGLRGDAGTLKRDLAALAERVGRVETKPQTAGLSPEAVQQSIDPLSTRLADFEARLAKVAKAQTEVETNSKAAALALALYNLRRAASEGKPYAAELKSIADLSPVPLDLAALEARRDQGIRSLDQLQAGFAATANRALDAENVPSDSSVGSEIWSKLKSFVRVRRKGDVEGDDTQAILARIEHKLANRDLAGAVADAGALKGAAAEAVAPWLADLKAKLAADEALARAETRILTALGGEDRAKRGG